jgi:NAD(P)-dependent dehydrogenase (short-subunit alcohol dehydrogenase family)
MVDGGWGRIVNIRSSSTHSGTPNMSHHVAAKSAANSFDQVAGAGVRTGKLGGVHATIDATPVRRIGKPEDIAAACTSLISEEAGYITGQILGVNGGRNT